MRRLFKILSEWSDYLSGMLLGAILWGFLVSQAKDDTIAELHQDYRARLEKASEEHRQIIDNLPDVDEECAELLERNLNLEVDVVRMKQELYQSAVDCAMLVRRTRRNCE